MSNYPDFKQYNYQVERELGQNSVGGRITYLATDLKTQQSVAIKQFQFAQSVTSWAGYNAIEAEIQLLRSLCSPHIPCYLNSFETSNGFCLVQEYKEATSLSQLGYFSPDEIKQIAIVILEVLVYLQQQHPPIIHRDIKPENILVDRSTGKMKVYLVDFGLARLGGENLAVSSAVKGTLGFMPPEQMFDRHLTAASDLYSLGATLICLLTGTKSSEIGNLIDYETYRFNFRGRLPQLNSQFIDWLEKMTAPNLNNRYTNAEIALKSLLQIRISGDLDRPNQHGNLIQMKKFAINRELITTSILALVVVQWAIAWIPWPQSPVQQLLKTGVCSRCNLMDINLQETNLEGSELSRSELARANLKGSNLVQADLEGANLEGADLINAHLGRVNLQGANLNNAYLEGADLIRANLANADLEGADLVRAELVRANLEGADLMRTSLEGANLVRVNLEGADLGRANLKGANLGGANLEGANLKGANLEGADLTGAKLESANLEGTNLKGAIVPFNTNKKSDLPQGVRSHRE
ncbi:MAG: pentapeptide repeat-containing protein [Xenococcaceae cyanobacterium]